MLSLSQQICHPCVKKACIQYHNLDLFSFLKIYFATKNREIARIQTHSTKTMKTFSMIDVYVQYDTISLHSNLRYQKQTMVEYAFIK